MLRKIGSDAIITSNPEILYNADKLILPGVGHFKKGMENLASSGLVDVLHDLVMIQQKPILGICLGAQLMTRHSEEGNVDGLGWVDGHTIRFDVTKMNTLKIPHMGWSDIQLKDAHPLWHALPQDPRFYHVHSYHFVMDDQTQVSATATYGYDFVCAFKKDNIMGTQFHPEKSHKFGMQVLENFSKL